MGERADEMMHFTRHGELWHAWYRVREHRFGQFWQKIHGSEEVCRCVEREADRNALMGVKEKA